MTSQIDVLMPIYNAKLFISDALASIQAQTIRDIRIIVVDDGSTDGSGELLADAARCDPRIHVITQANAGIVAALNTGLAACTAPIIARHDADDLSYPDRFEKQMRYLDENPNCVAVAGPARQIDEAGVDLGTQTRLRDLAKADENAIPAYEPYLLHPMLMLRRSAINAVGGYRLVLNAEDSDLYWRLLEQGELHNLSEPLGSYRMHGSSLTSASIESGRRGALYAQLAAISAQRRARNDADITFDVGLLTSIKSVSKLEDIYAAACYHLTEQEQKWLAVALSAKLMEFCFYRPFELSLDDCYFIRQAINSNIKFISNRYKSLLRESILGTSVRLAQNGRLRCSAVLTGNMLIPVLLARLTFRTLIPVKLRNSIKASLKST